MELIDLKKEIEQECVRIFENIKGRKFLCISIKPDGGYVFNRVRLSDQEVIAMLEFYKFEILSQE